MGTIAAGGDEPPTDAGTNDRREALRRSVVDSHLITVDLAFQSGALLLDLSETGMGVQALSSAPIGTITPVHFELPETGGRVEGVGRIAWTDSSGRLGIRFEEVAELSRLNLAQWLSQERRPLAAPGLNLALPTWPPPHMRDETAALRRDLTIEKLEGKAALTFIVERMRNVTRATGAAIALEEDGLIVCRASSGNAPGVGARVDPDSGLSGECVRSGEIVRCEDAETDPRADRLVCRRLELRSMVIVPVRLQGRPSGLLEVFSSRPHAFQSSDVLLLRRVSDLVAEIAVRHSQPPSAPPSPQALNAAVLLDPFLPESQAEPAISPMMDESLSLEFERILAPPPLREAKPLPDATPAARAAAQPEAAAPAQPAPAIGQPAAEAVEQSAAEYEDVPVEVARAAAIPATAEALPDVKPEIKTELKRSPEHSSPPVEKTLASAEVMASSLALAPPETVVLSPTVAPADVSAPDFARPRTMAAAAAAERAPLPLQPAPKEEEDVVPVWERSSEPDAALASVLGVRQSSWNQRIAGACILLAVAMVGGWQVWRAMAPVKGAPMNSELAKPAAPPAMTSPAPLAATNTIEVPVAMPAVLPGPKPGIPQPAGVEAKAASPPASPKNAPAKSAPANKMSEPITLAPPDLGKVEASDAPPPIVVAARSEPPTISNVLHAPVAVPRLDAAPVSQLSGGKLIKRYDPLYPSSAAGQQGEVVLKASINREGKVTAVKIVSGKAVLAQAAASAVQRWRYEPFLLNGFPIEVESTIVVKFTAPGR